MATTGTFSETLYPSDPLIVTAVRQAERSLQAVVSDIGPDLPLLGAALFAPDDWHVEDAGVLAVVDRDTAPKSHLSFVKDAIRGRRVFMPRTNVGHTIKTGYKGFGESLMNDNHIVHNMPIALDHGKHAVMQMAFNKAASGDYGGLPARFDPHIAATWKRHGDDISDSVHTVLSRVGAGRSFSDELHLNVPVTPNAFVLNWDVSGSKQVARTDYTALRRYMDELMEDAACIAEPYGGEVLRCEGDGQWLMFRIPEDRYDDLGQFAAQNALHAARQIVAYHQQRLGSQGLRKPFLRCAVGIGYVESTRLHLPRGEYIERQGSVFWDVQRASKGACRDRDVLMVTTDMYRVAYPQRNAPRAKSVELSL